MNEQFLFYWLSWLLIISVYFFMQKRNVKYLFLTVLFITINTVDWKVTLFDYMYISIAYIVIFISSLCYYARFRISFYHIAVTLTIMIGFVALLILVKIAPIWFIVDYYIMIPLIIAFMLVLLEKSFYIQIAIITTALSNGYFVYGLILISYHLHNEIIDLQFFILLYINVLLLFIVYVGNTIVTFTKTKLMNN